MLDVIASPAYSAGAESDLQAVEVQSPEGSFVGIPKEQAAKMSSGDGGAGIGVKITEDADHDVVIGGVFQGSPAEKAGISSGDILLSVGELGNVKGANLADVSKALRGRPGTVVFVRVKKKTSGKVKKITIKRTADFLSHTAPKLPVSILEKSLAELGAKSCPPNYQSCHYLAVEGSSCVYSCPKQ